MPGVKSPRLSACVRVRRLCAGDYHRLMSEFQRRPPIGDVLSADELMRKDTEFHEQQAISETVLRPVEA
jgi:hypothetical protein